MFLFRIQTAVHTPRHLPAVGRPHGNAMTVLQNDAYSVAQNSQTGEYYLLTDQEQVQVDLYFPQRTETLTVTRGDQTDTIRRCSCCPRRT